jgi:hypothetical protein
VLHQRHIVIVAALALAAVLLPAAWAEEERPPEDKDLRGRFVRLIAQEWHGRDYVGMEIKSEGSRDLWRLLIPMKTNDNGDLVPDEQTIARARRLRLKQDVEITYYFHEKWNWIRKLEVPQPKK